MSEIVLGITLLAFILCWKLVWQKTLLDCTRDNLFDLRNELRTWFINNGYGLEHTAYHELRNILNSHLRNTENATLISYISFIYVYTKHPEYRQEIDSNADNIFNTEDKKINFFIKSIRDKAFHVLMTQMILRNMFISICLLILIPIFFTYKILYNIIKKVKNKIGLSTSKVIPIMSTVMIGIIYLLSLLRIDPLTMEKYSRFSQTIPANCHST